MEEKAKSTDLTPKQEAHQEGQKLLYDAFKHLTTLSTGSILLLATFLEKFFKNPEWPALIAVALVGFIVSIVSAFITMLVLSDNIFYLREKSETGSRSGTIGFYISLGSFVISIFSLTVFSLKNFY